MHMQVSLLMAVLSGDEHCDKWDDMSGEMSDAL
jgi:hypothetical protein